MQLVNRLLLRLMLVGMAAISIALALTLLAAKRDIADEVDSSQRIGQLIATLGALQGSGSLAAQATAIDGLNEGGTLRHFHVALLDDAGRRLTRQPAEADEGFPGVLRRWLVRDLDMPTTTLSVMRPDGQRLVVMLEPNPRSESSEAITSALLQFGLFGAVAVALIVALWFSVRRALAPLSDILSAIARLEAGDYAVRIRRCATRELDQIGRALNHLAEVLTEQIARQRELLHRLQDVQEDERRKLAHELHDEFGQLLTAIQVDASYLMRQSAGQSALEACTRAVVENSGAILAQLRSLLAQLRPYGLQGGEEHDIALGQALRDLVAQRQSRGDAELDCRLSIALDAVAIPPRLAVAVYRIVQEALTNVMRHAQASRVQIAVVADEAASVLELSVIDDGRGLDPARASSGGIGIAGIRERVLANGGELRLEPATPSGLALTARFPLG
ncbi:MAG: histidine kinase [Burkholderiaceae bacterium]|nr:histidine kinase [Burkholderiaceae bacterium]